MSFDHEIVIKKALKLTDVENSKLLKIFCGKEANSISMKLV
jgi:hypothetical protein